jgi:hypothetical protein
MLIEDHGMLFGVGELLLWTQLITMQGWKSDRAIWIPSGAKQSVAKAKGNIMKRGIENYAIIVWSNVSKNS